MEIKNYLGEKYVRRIDCLGDTKVFRTEDQKDDVILKGTDLEKISLTCALIN